MRRSPFVGSFLGSLLQPLLTKVGVRAARYIAVGGFVLAAVAWRWWQAQPGWVKAAVVVAALGLVIAVVERKWKHRARPRPLPDEPTQVLYRWWEPRDLPDGTVCFCGKPRRAGELVYIGITGAHRSRELDDDRRQSCWWRPGLVGTTETFLTRDDVERAEAHAIKTERPRENKMHNRVWVA